VATTTHLLATRLVTVGEFRCPADDPAWHETNYIGDEPHIVFPLTAVFIDQVDRDAVLTTPNHTVFYDAGQRYRRRLESDRGDHCIFIQVRPDVLERLAGGPLPAMHAPNEHRTFLERHVLVRRLRAGRITERAAEDAALDLARAALAQPADAPRARRERTAAAHRDLADCAKALLARSLSEPLPLSRLAARLRTSPYHLARVFRAQTGFTVDVYGRSLRLRAALERLPAYGDGLTALALELGFSSHSHFTETFRREFGVVPSSLR
jgi:AraC family transcriptional regulator